MLGRDRQSIRAARDAIDDFRQAAGVDDLWRRLHRRLAPYEINGVYYGFHALPGTRVTPNIINSGFHLTSYDPDYIALKFSDENVGNDPYYSYVLQATEPLLWSDFSFFSDFTPEQRNSVAIDFDFDVVVGVTLPFRFFDGMGRAGCSLQTQSLSWQEFDAQWREHGQAMNAVVAAFDAAMRENCLNEYFDLSRRERECLSWLADGLRPQQIAHRLGTHVKTIEKQIESARVKLKSATNAQALAKALVLGVINP